MARSMFSTYLTDLQRRKLALIAEIEEVSGSCWLGQRIDEVWTHLYGSAHPAALEAAREPARRATRADGRRFKVRG